MKDLSLKLRLIYYPFLSIAAGFVFVYSFLNEALTMHTSTITLKEDLTDVWLPLILPYIPLYFWLWPKIMLLRVKPPPLSLKPKRDNNHAFGFILVAAFAIGIPTFLFQGYLRTATGKLTKLDFISQIRESKLTKYYSVKNYYVDTAFVSLKNIYMVSGKHKEYLNYTIYAASPVFNKRMPVIASDGEDVKITPIHSSEGRDDAEGVVREPQAWVCVKYHEQISNRLDSAEKEREWRTFFDNSLADFRSKDPNAFIYLDRTGISDDRDYYEAAIKKSHDFKIPAAPPIVLEPRSTAFEDRNGHKAVWAFGAFGIGAIVWLLLLLIPELDTSLVET